MPSFVIPKRFTIPLTDNPPDIGPVGIGDLKLVKQVLARYEAGEIAHIENVLQGEFRQRKHRRFQQLEEIVTVEKATEKESERDLQTTERFEMQTESETVVKEETKFEAGLSLSAGYGPVQISANTEFGMDNSKERSDRTATNYAKEVSEKAVSRLKEKIKEERVSRVLQETEEKNLHEFAASDNHVCGMYRWVDKFYRAKTIDYGRRLFYQFYIPEPAAFYLKAKANDLETSLPEMPLLPEVEHPNTKTLVPLSPELIDRYNYISMIKKYNVPDVEAPPPNYTVIVKTISRELQQTTSGEISEFALDKLIEIPSGYEAISAYGNFSVRWKTSKGRIVFLFGKRKQEDLFPVRDLFLESSEYYKFHTLVYAEDRSFPIAITGYDVSNFSVTIEIVCRLQIESEEQWQIKTYNAIMTAYEKERMEFEDKIAAAEVSGVASWGQNPLINREIEKQELKRSCIRLWSGYDLGGSPGIIEDIAAEGVDSYPEIDRDTAMDNVHAIRFFEEAFEWENMTYEFAPYYWGNKEKWIDTYIHKSEDPIFEQFLRAGAANVLVPVRPSWTGTVLYYQLTGRLWIGDGVPRLLASPSSEEAELFNDYLEEMVGVEDIPESETERVFEISPDDKDSWLVKVPTSLVWLQQEDSILPDFENQ